MKQGCAHSIREKRFTNHWERDFGKPSFFDKAKGQQIPRKRTVFQFVFCFSSLFVEFRQWPGMSKHENGCVDHFVTAELLYSRELCGTVGITLSG